MDRARGCLFVFGDRTNIVNGPKLEKGNGLIVPFKDMPASTFREYWDMADAMPGELEYWLLAAINQLRTKGVGVHELSHDGLWEAIFDCVDTARSATGEEPLDRKHAGVRRAELAGLLTLMTRVFGLAFAPASMES
jgi:hypothetical protein